MRTLHDYDATLIEEVFSDGLLNVMSAPEFAQSDKLRRVFSALENRTYLGQLVGSVAGTGRFSTIRMLRRASLPAPLLCFTKPSRSNIVYCFFR